MKEMGSQLFCTHNARASAAARWLGLGTVWSEYKYLLDYTPTSPGLLRRILTNFAGYTPPNLNAGWAVGSKRLLGGPGNNSPDP